MAATAFVGAAQVLAPPQGPSAAAAPPQGLRGAGAAARPAATPEAPLAWAALGAAMGGTAAAAAAAGRGRTRRAGRTARRADFMKVEAPAPTLNPDKFSDVCEQTGVTLSRYMIELSKRGVVDGDLNSIMASISEGTKVIANLIAKAPLRQADLLGLEGEVNVQGEDQKKLDVITNEVLKNALRYTGKLGTMASEEEDDPVSVEDPDMTDEFNTKVVGETGSYVCVFDPLDGSSNVDAGIPVGTIFGVFKEPDDGDCDIDLNGGEMDEAAQACLAATLQPGKNLVAAGYVFYSASTEFVVTFGNGVVGFTLDHDICDYKLTRPDIKIPARGSIYSLNQANEAQWDEPMRQWIHDLQEGKGQTGKRYTQRYIGSMVGDVHRTLLYGGVFAYPADEKNKDGKLRLLYEAAPMSFLLEQAGGKSITGHSRVMDIPPTNVHQRVPIILGSPDDIDECYGYYDRCKDPALQARCEARLKGVKA